MPSGRRIVLARRPDGLPRREDFRLECIEIRAPDEGEALVRSIYCTADPGSRGRLGGEKSYARPMAQIRPMP